MIQWFTPQWFTPAFPDEPPGEDRDAWGCAAHHDKFEGFSVCDMAILEKDVTFIVYIYIHIYTHVVYI